MSSRTSVGGGLSSLVRPEYIFPNLQASERDGVLHELSRSLVEAGGFGDQEELFRLLREREELGSTGIGHGVAVPHCKASGISDVLLAVGIAPDPVDFGQTIDGEPVRVFFVVVSPAGSPALHLQTLATISRWVKSAGGIEPLIVAQDSESILACLREVETP